MSWTPEEGAADSPEPRVAFTLAAGFVLPAVCVVIDAMQLFSVSIFGREVVCCYGVIGLEMLCLLAWHAFRSRLDPWSAFFGGVFIAGAVSAFLVGLMLLPMSIFLFFRFGIGVLGLCPFLTAIVYWRTARRASVVARSASSLGRRRVLAAMGMLLVFALPWAGARAVERWVAAAVHEVETGGATSVERVARRLRPVAAICPASLWPLRQAFDDSTERVAKENLIVLYSRLTGRPWEDSWRLTRGSWGPQFWMP